MLDAFDANGFDLRRRFRRRLGLTVTASELSVLLVRGTETIEQRDSEPIGPDDTRAEAIQRLVQRVLDQSSGSWRHVRPTVWVAIDLPTSQIKTIRGLPAVEDAHVLTQLLAATPERFFLGHHHGIITAGARVLAPGIVESVAFDRSVLDDIHQACTAMGLQVALFVPASVALAYARQSDHDRQETETLDIAYGATQVPRREPLAVRSHIHTTALGAPHRRHLAIAGGVAIISILIAILTPAVLALRTSRLARQKIATLAPARAAALAVDRDVAVMSATIRTVRTFEQHRHSKTLLLAQLTQALPAGAVITTLTADTAGITVVALAPKAADVVRSIEEMLGASHVTLVGPVTHEATVASTPTVGGGVAGARPGIPMPADVERVTVRFQIAEDGASIRQPLDRDTTE